MRGRVIHGVDQTPVAGATVMLCTRGESKGNAINEPWHGCFQDLADVSTADDGSFDVFWMPSEGQRKIGRRSLAKSPAYARALLVIHEGYEPVLVAGEQLGQAVSRSGLTVALSPLATVSGTVLVDGAPPQGMQVGWFTERRGGLHVRHIVQRGGKGRFGFDDIPPGRVTIYAIDSRSRTYATVDVSLEPGDDQEIDLVLDQVLARIEGRLLDGAGDPLSMALATAEPSGGTTETVFDRVLKMVQQRRNRIDFDGEFELLFQTPGRYQVRFWSRTCETCGGGKRPLTQSEATAEQAGSRLRASASQPSKMVTCTLSDAKGNPVGIWQYDVYCIDPNLHHGWGHSGGDIVGVSRRNRLAPSTIHFVWPQNARRIRLRLTGEKLTGSVELTYPVASCQVVGE